LPTLLITQAEKYSTIVALSVIVVTDFWTSQVECPHPPPSKPIVMEIESKQPAATNYCKLLKYFRFVFGIYRYIFLVKGFEGTAEEKEWKIVN